MRNTISTEERTPSTSTEETPVYVVVLSWNGLPDTLECIDSLERSAYPICHLVLVDNGSTDTTIISVRDRYPGVRIIQNSHNLGYAEGNNVGIRYALEKGADYILLLNNDCTVPPDTISQLVAVADRDPLIGIVCPVIVSHYDHTKQFIGTIDWRNGSAGEKLVPSTTKICFDAEYASGCALLIKSRVVREIGLLDPAYFAYYEDVDWSLRCKKAGYRVVVVGEARTYHKGTPDRTELKSPILWYYYIRNQRLFVRKYIERNHQLLLLVRYTLNCLVQFRRAMQENNEGKGTAILDGWWAGVIGRYGARRLTIPSRLRWLILRCLNGWCWFAQRIRQLRRICLGRRIAGQV